MNKRTIQSVLSFLTGIAFLTGGVTDFSVWLQSTFPILSSLG